jgi:CRP-like cAMP-binding protein
MTRRKSQQPSAPSIKALRRNAILNGLADADLAMLAARGTFVFLEPRHVVYNANEVIKDVVFPIDCVLSVVTYMHDGGSIEVGTIGYEGVSAIPLLLGGTTSANECYCQVPGDVFVVDAKRFQELASSNHGFRLRLDRFLQAYVNMLGQLAACNGMHNIYERTARWLLMTHDRVAANKIRLTHEFLSMMLGARRSGVTIAAATLQQAGFIRYSRGHIVIVNRRGLEDAACECYEVARLQFSALLPPTSDKQTDGKPPRRTIPDRRNRNR